MAHMPERVQVARIPLPAGTASRSDMFPVSLGKDEIGIALAISGSVRLSTNSSVWSFMLSTKEVAAASVAGLNKRIEHLVWDMYVGTAEASAVGVVKRTENQYFHFPYPIPFIRGPWLLTYGESGTMALALFCLYYLKQKVKGDVLAEMMVKEHG